MNQNQTMSSDTAVAIKRQDQSEQQANLSSGDALQNTAILLETDIRALAHAKWEAAGSPSLMSDEERNAFWYEAEKELAEERKGLKGGD